MSRAEIDALAARLAAKSGADIFLSAFLDIEHPSIPEGLEACVQKGATRITVLPNFLSSGRHVLEHVPAIVREFESSHPGAACRITPCIGLHPGIDTLYLDLMK